MTTTNMIIKSKSPETPASQWIFFPGFLANITIAWKMVLMVSVLFLGTSGVTISAYIGIQSLRYQFSNIYDFMLVPITSINQADTALADVQYDLAQLGGTVIAASQQAHSLEDLQSHEKLATDIIARYDTEWVTTASPQFTQDLKNGGKLELQQQEVASLAAYHAAFDVYKTAAAKYLATVQAGEPDASLANDAIQKLQSARTDLESLIAVNNKFADFSNTQAQAAFRQALLNGGVALTFSVLLGLFLSYLIVVSITSRLGKLTRSAAAMEEGKLEQTVAVAGRDEVALLGTTFNRMAAQLRDMIASLEQRVSAATRNLTLAAEVGRNVGQVHNLDTLLKSAAELIQDRFNLYYTQVYLLDASGRQLVLRAGTGAVGQQLMGRRHSLPVDLASLNGAAAVESRAVIVENTETSSIHRPNPLLPDTRSEMVIPLMVRERVVGTLDMQSSQAGALNKENLSAFEALAGQLAIAVENASLLAETDAARATMEIQSRRLVRSNWQDFLNAVERGERIGYTYNLENMDTCVEPVSPGVNGRDLVTNIPVLNEPVGVFKFEGEQSWSKDDAALVDNIAHQLGQQIENLRLLAQADKYRAEAEQAIVRLTRQGWESQIAAHPDSATGFTYDLNSISPLTETGNSNRAPRSTQILEVRGEKIGELSIAGTKKTGEDVAELLSAVGAQLSARVENLRLFEETERSQVEVEKRARQLAAVAEVSTVSAKELNVDKMLASVVSLTQRQFGLYHAHIYLNDEKGEELRIAACGWMEGDEHEGSKENTVIALAQERSLVARAAREGRAVIVNDVQGEPGWLPNPLLPDTAAEMAVPLVVGEQILGVLDVQSDRVNAFSEEDASIQTTLASQVAIALQNARSFTQAQRQAERETALNAISQQIQRATTVEAVLQIAARELGRALGAPLTIAQLGLQEQSVAGGNGSNGRN